MKQPSKHSNPNLSSFQGLSSDIKSRYTSTNIPPASTPTIQTPNKALSRYTTGTMPIQLIQNQNQVQYQHFQKTKQLVVNTHHIPNLM